MLIIKIQSLFVRGPQQHEKCILKPESDQNQNSLLVKRQTDNTTPGGMGLDRRGLVPSSHKRSKFRHTII